MAPLWLVLLCWAAVGCKADSQKEKTVVEPCPANVSSRRNQLAPDASPGSPPGPSKSSPAPESRSQSFRVANVDVRVAMSNARCAIEWKAKNKGANHWATSSLALRPPCDFVYWGAGLPKTPPGAVGTAHEPQGYRYRDLGAAVFVFVRETGRATAPSDPQPCVDDRASPMQKQMVRVVDDRVEVLKELTQAPCPLGPIDQKEFWLRSH